MTRLRPVSDGGPPVRELALAGLIVVLGVLLIDFALRDELTTRREAAAPPASPPASPVITPPDQGRPSPARAPSAAQLVAARRVARRFLDGYLAYLYGRAPAGAVREITPAVRRELSRSVARIPPAQRDRTPRVSDLDLVGQASEAVIATASIDDGDVAVYPIVFTLDLRDGRWRVSRLAND